MAFSSTLRAVLELNTNGFERGLSSVNQGLNGLKKTLAPVGGGGLFSRFLGVGAVIGAFTSAITRAQELRSEAMRLGKPIDESVARVAKLGDAFKEVKTGVQDLGVTVLGFFTSIGEKAGRQIVRLKGLAQGKSFAESDAAVASSEQAGTNADRLQAESADPSAVANAKKRDELREAARQKELADIARIEVLEEEIALARSASTDMSKTLSERLAAQVTAEEKIAQQKAVQLSLDRQIAAARAGQEAVIKSIAMAQLDAAGQIAYIEDEILALTLKRVNAENPADRIEAETQILILSESIRQIREASANKDSASRQAAYEEAQADESKLAALQQARAEAAMTDEQKLAAVINAGRQALAEFNENPSDVKAAIKVEELRNKYDALTKSIAAANAARDGKGPKGPEDPDAVDRNEKGQIVRNGAVVSQEDRNRSRSTTARNATLNEQTRSQQIQSTATKPPAQPGGELKTALSVAENHLETIATAVSITGTN